jgi:hypothetical protein
MDIMQDKIRMAAVTIKGIVGAKGDQQLANDVAAVLDALVKECAKVEDTEAGD